MKDSYDFSKAVRRPDMAEARRKRVMTNGYKIIVADGGERFVTPEEATAEILAADERREEWRRQNRV
jgi:hypothetical protein